MGNSDRFVDLLQFMTVLVLSVALHEMAHAWLADRFGDETPRVHGRLTLNPFAHVHPILTVALPAYFYWDSGGVLFMASTPVRPWQMRRPRLHGMLTSLGGPAASLLLGAACFAAMVLFVAATGAPDGSRALHVFRLAVLLNVFGAAFNLLPIPPLDGSSIVEFLLPRGLLPAWASFRRWSWILFVVLVVTKALSPILEPVLGVTALLVEMGVELGRWMGRG